VSQSRFDYLLLLGIFLLSAAMSSGHWPNAALDTRVQQLVGDLRRGFTAYGRACTEIMRIGPPAGAAVPALLAHVDQGNEALAVNALLAIGPAAATGGLIQALDGEDKKTARFAAQVIGLFGPAAAAAKPALLRAATDPDLQSAATESLREIGVTGLALPLQRRPQVAVPRPAMTPPEVRPRCVIESFQWANTADKHAYVNGKVPAGITARVRVTAWDKAHSLVGEKIAPVDSDGAFSVVFDQPNYTGHMTIQVACNPTQLPTDN
jgi:hypothetical protein